MNRHTNHALIAIACAAQAALALASWRSIPLESGDAMVSSIVVGDSTIAVGLSEGGMRILSLRGDVPRSIQDPAFGEKGRIHDLARIAGRFVIASEGGIHLYDPATGGLERLPKSSGQAALAGVRILQVRANELWMGGPKGISMVDGAGAGRFRTWKLPSDGDQPLCLMVVGSTVLVGTESTGLLILDMVSGTWTRVGRKEGLPQEQVTGLEMVGGRIYAGTPKGLAMVELSTRAIGVAAAGMVNGWMTQVNGVLVVSTFEGLVRVDGTTLKAAPMPMDKELVPEGALAFGNGILATGGTGGRLLTMDFPTFLGDRDLETISDGFLVKVPAALPKNLELAAQLRIPEWPAASIPARISAGASPNERILHLPSGASGRFILELNLQDGKAIVERRTFEVMADRLPPFLELDPVQGWSRERSIVLGGRAGAPSGVSLFRVDDPRPIELDDQGRFTVAVPLADGANIVRFRAIDAAGNVSEREVAIVRDSVPPLLTFNGTDTVDGDRAQLEFALEERNLKSTSVEPADKASMIVGANSVLVNLRDLAPGRNRVRVHVVDMADNRIDRDVVIVRRPKPGDAVVSDERPSTPGDAVGKEDRAQGLPPGAQAGGVVVVRYGMKEGETIRKVAERFYGSREMAPVLIRWNNLSDSAQWRRMPVGTTLDVPFWRDFRFGGMTPREAVSTLPKRSKP